MKKLIWILSFLFYSINILGQNGLKGTRINKFPFYIYYDKDNINNHYFPSGWMGDYKDLSLNENWTNQSYSGKTCIQIQYRAEQKQGNGWTGVYWQNPANNWGTTNGGYNLTGAKRLFFFARGEKGGELIEFKLGGITGEYPDSVYNSTELVELTKDWQLFELDLEDQDLSYVSGGFCFVMAEQANPNGSIFYLDEIYYHNGIKPIKTKK